MPLLYHTSVAFLSDLLVLCGEFFVWGANLGTLRRKVKALPQSTPSYTQERHRVHDVLCGFSPRNPVFSVVRFLRLVSFRTCRNCGLLAEGELKATTLIRF